MNRYGQQAMQYWQDMRPEDLAQLSDPQQFFTRMGEDLEAAIEDLARDLAAPVPERETYLDRVRRLGTARAEAESQTLRAMLTTPQESPAPTGRG